METIIQMLRDESEHPHLELRPDANLDFPDAASWYDSYGYHLATQRAGDVPLQAIDYRWMYADKATVLAAVLSVYPKMCMHEARLLLSKAREVRRAADRIEELLQSAVDDYRSGNLQGVIDNLGAASDEEREHGDDPATASLAQQLLRPNAHQERIYAERRKALEELTAQAQALKLPGYE